MHLKNALILLFLFTGLVTAADIKMESYSNGVFRISVTTETNAYNLVALNGSDGLLLVDSGEDVVIDEVQAFLYEKFSRKVRYVANTHLHADHIGGNTLLAETATIIGHRNMQKQLNSGLNVLLEVPEAAMPVINVKESLVLDFNNQKVRFVALGKAHTATDLLVYFPLSEVLCIGDILLKGNYPLIDTQGGGDLKTYEEAVNYILDNFPETTRFITGHGEDITRKELVDLKTVIQKSVSTVQSAIDNNVKLTTLAQQKPFSEWDAQYGKVFISTNRWIQTVNGALNKTGNKKEGIIIPLYKTLKEKGVDALVEKYHTLAKSSKDKYDFGEGQLNYFGYMRLQKNKIDEAIALFKLNIEAFPNSVNVYDSLGEALEKKKDLKNAQKNYTLAVQKATEQKSPNLEYYKKNLDRVKKLQQN